MGGRIQILRIGLAQYWSHWSRCLRLRDHLIPSPFIADESITRELPVSSPKEVDTQAQPMPIPQRPLLTVPTQWWIVWRPEQQEVLQMPLFRDPASKSITYLLLKFLSFWTLFQCRCGMTMNFSVPLCCRCVICLLVWFSVCDLFSPFCISRDSMFLFINICASLYLGLFSIGKINLIFWNNLFHVISRKFRLIFLERLTDHSWKWKIESCPVSKLDY